MSDDDGLNGGPNNGNEEETQRDERAGVRGGLGRKKKVDCGPWTAGCTGATDCRLLTGDHTSEALGQVLANIEGEGGGGRGLREPDIGLREPEGEGYIGLREPEGEALSLYACGDTDASTTGLTARGENSESDNMTSDAIRSHFGSRPGSSREIKTPAAANVQIVQDFFDEVDAFPSAPRFRSRPRSQTPGGRGCRI